MKKLTFENLIQAAQKMNQDLTAELYGDDTVNACTCDTNHLIRNGCSCGEK